MLKFILFALIGIAINFISKFSNSESRMKDFSMPFWAKDNWPELVIGILITIAAMMMLLDPATTFDEATLYGKLATYAPFLEGIFLPLKSIFSMAIGLFCNHLVYWVMKKKVKE